MCQMTYEPRLGEMVVAQSCENCQCARSPVKCVWTRVDGDLWCTRGNHK